MGERKKERKKWRQQHRRPEKRQTQQKQQQQSEDDDAEIQGRHVKQPPATTNRNRRQFLLAFESRLPRPRGREKMMLMQTARVQRPVDSKPHLPPQ